MCTSCAMRSQRTTVDAQAASNVHDETTQPTNSSFLACFLSLKHRSKHSPPCTFQHRLSDHSSAHLEFAAKNHGQS